MLTRIFSWCLQVLKQKFHSLLLFFTRTHSGPISMLSNMQHLSIKWLDFVLYIIMWSSYGNELWYVCLWLVLKPFLTSFNDWHYLYILLWYQFPGATFCKSICLLSWAGINWVDSTLNVIVSGRLSSSRSQFLNFSNPQQNVICEYSIMICALVFSTSDQNRQQNLVSLVATSTVYLVSIKVMQSSFITVLAGPW